MQTKDWWYLLATVVSPFLAAGLTALLTLYWQNRRERRDAKIRVFTAIMASRRNLDSFQMAQEWARAVNTIDVVFDDCPEVLQIWRELYNMLQQETAVPGQAHKMIELYSAMAKDLGFKNLPQTAIDQGHCPKAVSDPVLKAAEVTNEFLRVLKNTQSFAVIPTMAAIANDAEEKRTVAQATAGGQR